MKMRVMQEGRNWEKSKKKRFYHLNLWLEQNLRIIWFSQNRLSQKVTGLMNMLLHSMNINMILGTMFQPLAGIIGLHLSPHLMKLLKIWRIKLWEHPPKGLTDKLCRISSLIPLEPWILELFSKKGTVISWVLPQEVSLNKLRI